MSYTYLTVATKQAWAQQLSQVIINFVTAL